MRLEVINESFLKELTKKSGVSYLQLLEILNKKPIYGEQAAEADLRKGSDSFNEVSFHNVVIKLEEFKFNLNTNGITAEVSKMGVSGPEFLSEGSVFRSRFCIGMGRSGKRNVTKLSVVAIDIV